MLRQSIIENLSGSIHYTVNGKHFKLNLNKKLKGQNEHLNFDIKVFNAFDHAILQAQVKSLEKIKLIDLRLSSVFKYYDNDRVFCNGYQSWSECHLSYVGDKISKLNTLSRPFLKYSGDYSFYRPKSSVLSSWTYSYIQSDNQVLMFAGSLNEESAYTIIEHETSKKKIHFTKDVEDLEINGNYSAFDILLYDGKRMDAFQFWFDKLKIEKQTKKLKTGWNSWYRHKNKISEDIINKNLESYASSKVPLDYFQIDDGWQKAVGDWEISEEKFPNGISPLANSISEAGYKPGIWMAPFICEKNSSLYKEKRNWLLKADGKNVKAGYSPDWSGWFYLLDIEKQEVKHYIAEKINELKKVGFKLFKFDFLYALGLSKNNSKSRYQKINEGVKWLTALTEDCETILCGLPLANAMANTEFMRIGPDSHRSYDFKWLDRFNFRERPSFRNALKNSILRSELHGFAFSNDPDVSYLTTKTTKLSEAQIKSQFYLNYIVGGVQMTSENWDEITPTMRKLFQSMFPIKQCTLISIDRQKEAYFIDFTSQAQSYHFILNLGEKKINTQINSYGSFYDIISKAFIVGKQAIPLDIGESVCLIETAGADSSYLKETEHLLPTAIK